MSTIPQSTISNPQSLFVFFTRCETLLSRLIRRITASDLGPNGDIASGWSHCGIGFEVSSPSPSVQSVSSVVSSPSSLRRLYFEATITAHGFAGPRDFSDLLDWEAKDPRRLVRSIILPFEGLTLAEKWGAANVLVGVGNYDQLQLLGLWFRQRIGRFFGCHVPASKGLICSEAVCRILAPEYEFADPQHRLDEITPNLLYRKLKSRLVGDYAQAAGNDALATILRRLHVSILCSLCSFVAILSLSSGCNSLPDIPPLPFPTTTTTTIPAADYGDACDAPSADRKGESRVGNNPQVGIISTRPDVCLGDWANTCFQPQENADGSISLTACETITSPSGVVYVFASWRVAFSDSPDIRALTCTVPKGQRGDVTRVYYTPHKAK